jgi:hypothetical protein
MDIRVDMAGFVYEMPFEIFEKMIDGNKMIEIGDYLFVTARDSHQQMSVYKQLYYRLKREHLIDKIIE